MLSLLPFLHRPKLDCFAVEQRATANRFPAPLQLPRIVLPHQLVVLLQHRSVLRNHAALALAWPADSYVFRIAVPQHRFVHQLQSAPRHLHRATPQLPHHATHHQPATVDAAAGTDTASQRVDHTGSKPIAVNNSQIINNRASRQARLFRYVANSKPRPHQDCNDAWTVVKSPSREFRGE